MKMYFCFVEILFLFIYLIDLTRCDQEEKIFHFHMPNVIPAKETYYCTAHRLPVDDFQYIVEFRPNATMKIAHHILIYGCGDPGYYERDTPNGIWDCGEMSGSVSNIVRAPVCKSFSKIVYAWAMDAPKLKLPEGVGFKVGAGTGINFLVLQVHYGNSNIFDGKMTDSSGIDLVVLPSETKKVTKRAGVLLLGTAGIVQPGIEHMEVAGRIQEPVVLHPFGFRTHTHKLGKVVSGWRVNNKGWTLIGKHDPQKPQMFYPVEKKMTIKQGDVVAARCTMNNTKGEYVAIGATGNDEMCNFYMMYYVDGDRILERDTFFSQGPPLYYWFNDALVQPIPENIDIEASKI